MKNKSRKTPRKSTLVEFEMVEITDPAEQAALDRRCREAEKAMAVGEKAMAESARLQKLPRKLQEQTVMVVPTDLVPKIRALIAKRQSA